MTLLLRTMLMLVDTVIPTRARRRCCLALGTRGLANDVGVVELVACNVVVSVLLLAFFCGEVGLQGPLFPLLLPLLLLLLLQLLPVLPPFCTMWLTSHLFFALNGVRRRRRGMR